MTLLKPDELQLMGVFPGVDRQQLHVAFLSALPDASRAAALDANRSPGDEFCVLGPDVFLHLPDR